MLLVAKSVKGQEFFYKWDDSILASKKHAQRLSEVLNEQGFKKEEGLTWFVHEISKDEYYRASYKMVIKKGLVKLKPIK